MNVTIEEGAIPLKEQSLQPEQVLAILRLKFYEYYLRHGGREDVNEFEIWLSQQGKLIRVLNSIEERMIEHAGIVV